MKVGFTGSSERITPEQVDRLGRELFELCRDSELHHGDCVEADAAAHDVAAELGWRIVIHPPDNPRKRAFKARSGDTVWEPRPYLERNRDIVDETELLFATPKGFAEELRSGTWATIRYARKRGRRVRIIWPDGRVDQI